MRKQRQEASTKPLKEMAETRTARDSEKTVQHQCRSLSRKVKHESPGWRNESVTHSEKQLAERGSTGLTWTQRTRRHPKQKEHSQKITSPREQPGEIAQSDFLHSASQQAGVPAGQHRQGTEVPGRPLQVRVQFMFQSSHFPFVSSVSQALGREQVLNVCSMNE